MARYLIHLDVCWRSSWFWPVGITGGSHELNSETQLWIVLIGTMISTVLALVLRKNTSEKAQIWNVLPKPIEWAKMQPAPGDVENWSKFSTTLSQRKRIPPTWWGFAARANCRVRKMSSSSGGWPTFTNTSTSTCAVVGTFAAAFVESLRLREENVGRGGISGTASNFFVVWLVPSTEALPTRFTFAMSKSSKLLSPVSKLLWVDGWRSPTLVPHHLVGLTHLWCAVQCSSCCLQQPACPHLLESLRETVVVAVNFALLSISSFCFKFVSFQNVPNVPAHFPVTFFLWFLD